MKSYTNPKAAIVVGDLPDDPVIEIFGDLARANGFAVFCDAEPRSAIKRLLSSPALGKERTLICLCSDSVNGGSISHVAGQLYRHRQPNTRILVYAQAHEWSGELAMSCVKANAWDYLVRGDDIAPGNHFYDRVRDRISKTLTDSDPPFSKITGVPDLRRLAPKAFIITPYSPLRAREDYDSGVVPALRALNIGAMRGDEELRPTVILDKLREKIGGSDLVIANLSQYGRTANANVYFEVGYALGRGITPILVRRITEQRIPSDLRGIEIVEYGNCSDLALKLYFGLRDLC